MKDRWIALYVENQVGVLAKISGLFAENHNFRWTWNHGIWFSGRTWSKDGTS